MLKTGATDERNGKALRGWQTMPIDRDGANWDHRVDEDHWEQPGNVFRAMNADQRQAMFDNTARAMSSVSVTSASAFRNF